MIKYNKLPNLTAEDLRAVKNELQQVKSPEAFEEMINSLPEGIRKILLANHEIFSEIMPSKIANMLSDSCLCLVMSIDRGLKREAGLVEPEPLSESDVVAKGILDMVFGAEASPDAPPEDADSSDKKPHKRKPKE